MTTSTLAAEADGIQSGFGTAMDHVAQAFEALAALILIIGAIWAAILAISAWRHARGPARSYAVLRQAFGGSLLLALEVLVAADLIRTVAVSPSLDNVLGLGLIVVIRTFLSFSLQTEIEGVPPWRRAATSGATVVSRASQSAAGDRPAGHPPSGEP